MTAAVAYLASEAMIPESSESGFPGLLRIIESLLLCIREETEKMRSNLHFDVKASNARKSRLLYELGRASSSIDMMQLQTECRQKLALLKNELTGNARQVKGHMVAVREIAELMIEIQKKEETDGTYKKVRLGGPAR